VDAGDQVGRLGNSGNTDSPHLHFHVMDSPNPLASNGLPFVLELRWHQFNVPWKDGRQLTLGAGTRLFW